MSVPNFPDNVLYHSDNLEVLRGMNSETVDLIATDPPFNTQRNRSGTAGFYVDNWRWGDTDVLPDSWKWNEVHPIWLEQIKDDNPALCEVIEAAQYSHSDDLAAFLCFLSVRMIECHRILKPTGSLYLHCDHSAGHYIKLCLDAIFGAKNFRNEIVWAYTRARPAGKQFARLHDTIFYYSKSNKEWTFNKHLMQVPLSAEALKVKKIVRKDGTVWERKRDTKDMADWWPDVNLATGSKERTGSPDQKPLKLYERIILASSNEGDLVLDPFAGCATTLIASKNNNRRFVGIDRRKDFLFHVVCRMLDMKVEDPEDYMSKDENVKWIRHSAEQLGISTRSTPPARTDDGETGSELPGVYNYIKPATMAQNLMKTAIIEKYGIKCFGCGFVPPNEDHLQLDHQNPKSMGGSNDLDNRVLLCGPCNGSGGKGNKLTLAGLRAKNKSVERLYGDVPDMREYGAWARDYLEKRRVK